MLFLCVLLLLYNKQTLVEAAAKQRSVIPIDFDADNYRPAIFISPRACIVEPLPKNVFDRVKNVTFYFKTLSQTFPNYVQELSKLEVKKGEWLFVFVLSPYLTLLAYIVPVLINDKAIDEYPEDSLYVYYSLAMTELGPVVHEHDVRYKPMQNYGLFLIHIDARGEKTLVKLLEQFRFSDELHAIASSTNNLVKLEQRFIVPIDVIDNSKRIHGMTSTFVSETFALTASKILTIPVLSVIFQFQVLNNPSAASRNIEKHRLRFHDLDHSVTMIEIYEFISFRKCIICVRLTLNTKPENRKEWLTYFVTIRDGSTFTIVNDLPKSPYHEYENLDETEGSFRASPQDLGSAFVKLTETYGLVLASIIVLVDTSGNFEHMPLSYFYDKMRKIIEFDVETQIPQPGPQPVPNDENYKYTVPFSIDRNTYFSGSSVFVKSNVALTATTTVIGLTVVQSIAFHFCAMNSVGNAKIVPVKISEIIFLPYASIMVLIVPKEKTEDFKIAPLKKCATTDSIAMSPSNIHRYHFDHVEIKDRTIHVDKVKINSMGERTVRGSNRYFAVLDVTGQNLLTPCTVLYLGAGAIYTGDKNDEWLTGIIIEINAYGKFNIEEVCAKFGLLDAIIDDSVDLQILFDDIGDGVQPDMLPLVAEIFRKFTDLALSKFRTPAIVALGEMSQHLNYISENRKYDYTNRLETTLEILEEYF